MSFGVYKNFTAIDQHTTHEKEIIELRLQDTNGIENFVKNFAKSYYTWNNSKEAIEARTQAINGYLTKELQDLNVDTIRTDIPTSSTVTNVIVYDTLILLEKIKRALQLSNPNNFRELVKKDCTLDLHLSILKYQEQSIELTRNEFRILYYFFMNEDKVISKEELLEKLWNDKYYIDENVLLVNMTRLKKKMKEIGIVHLVENIRGKGWKL